MFVVLLGFIGLAIRYILVHQGFAGLFRIKPFYDPWTSTWRDIAGATSFAALTYLGFDAVTTLAEDVKNPRRNVMLAAVSVCAFTGLFGGLLVYLGQLVWPDYTQLSQRRDRVHRCHTAGGRAGAVSGHGYAAGGGQHRCGDDLAGGRRAFAFRHGPRCSDATAVLFVPAPGAQYAGPQYLAHRNSGLRRRTDPRVTN